MFIPTLLLSISNCPNECRRKCSAWLSPAPSNDTSIPQIPLRLYHPRQERSRAKAYYRNIYMSLDGGHGEARTVSRADAVRELHNDADLWANLDATRAALGLGAPEAVSPSAAPEFMRALIAERKPRLVIEVGVFLGYTTITMAKALDALYTTDAAPFVLSIDTWLGDAYMWALKTQVRCAQCSRNYADTLAKVHGKPAFYYQFLANVKAAGVAHRVVPLPLATNEAARVLDYLNWRPELVYIDASHDALDVVQVRARHLR